MKIFLKIVMLIILSLFVYLSLTHLLKLDEPINGAYWLVIFTIGSLLVYFLVFFLDLEIISKWVSIKQKMNNLENKQKQLSRIATTFNRFLIFFKYHTFCPVEVDKNFEIFERLQNEIKEYIDDSGIDDLVKELDESHNKFSGKTK